MFLSRFFKKPDSNKPKVKIIAVAKDEAAYFPEWVFHHFYLGIDAIDIYINRTSDNSIEMLKRLQKTYPNINMLSADWIDRLPFSHRLHLQSLVYQRAFKKAYKKGDFDYLLFIDIDEFLLPENLEGGVQQIIAKHPHADCISFGWFNEEGKNEFSHLESTIEGGLHILVKSLVKVSKNISAVRLHRPKIESGENVLIDGTPFKAGGQGDETLSSPLIKLREVMILHRMFRSEMEYVSSLNRGRPSSPDSLKLNRWGYNVNTGHAIFKIQSGFLDYSKKRERFFNKLERYSEWDVAKAFVRNRYEEAVANIEYVEPTQFFELVRTFGNTPQSLYEKVIEHVLQHQYLSKLESFDMIVKIAKMVEVRNKEFGLKFWKKASTLRPSGPLVTKKLKEYSEAK